MVVLSLAQDLAPCLQCNVFNQADLLPACFLAGVAMPVGVKLLFFRAVLRGGQRRGDAVA